MYLKLECFTRCDKLSGIGRKRSGISPGNKAGEETVQARAADAAAVEHQDMVDHSSVRGLDHGRAQPRVCWDRGIRNINVPVIYRSRRRNTLQRDAIDYIRRPEIGGPG